MRAEAVRASSVSGMKSLICAVWEAVDLREDFAGEASCEEEAGVGRRFEDPLGGTDADVG